MSETRACATCWGFGLWAMGDASPMGPIDAADGMPTRACPECGANPNPFDDTGDEDDEDGN